MHFFFLFQAVRNIRTAVGWKMIALIRSLKKDEIEYIIEHYEGSLKSFKGTTSTEENINGKSKKTTVKADYTVITDKQTYVLFFVEVSNTDDETENGIYRLWLSKESEKDAYYGHFDAGIYIPEE